MQINRNAAVHRNETKQQYFTLGRLPEKVSPAAAVQIAKFLWMETARFIYLLIYILNSKDSEVLQNFLVLLQWNLWNL